MEAEKSAHDSRKTCCCGQSCIPIDSVPYNPFECSVCLCLFDDSDNVPTTFQCGHSVCLNHVPQLTRCPMCRAAIPPMEQIRPSVALRDAAVLLAVATAEALARQAAAASASLQQQQQQQKATSYRRDPPPATSDSGDNSETSLFQQEDSWELVQAQIERIEAVSRRRLQIQADAQYARRVQAELDAEARQNRSPPPSRAPAAGLPDSRAATAATPAFDARPSPTCPGVTSGGICARPSCFLHRRWGRCCHCMDRREQQPEGTYPRYVDGQGWTNTGRRSAGYCIRCQS